MNAVVTFEQRVKARISEVAADLIPPEALDSMVTAQVAHFQREELPKMIKAAITEQYRLAVVAELAKPEYQHHWDIGGGYAASEAVAKIITENAADILANMIGGMAQNVVNQMRSNMPRTF